ncbi:MAG: hypothetical protein IKF47_03040 [Bacilli bacterium]|nr:hypothetical protein [Bacilli bacterium]
MNIDLSLLNSNAVSEIDISNTYSISKSYYENMDIVSIDDVKVNGKIRRIDNEDLEPTLYIDAVIDGVMIIPDSISLEEVEYPFHIEYNDFYEEIDKNNENTLDIFAFLWENIVLEVPLQFTKVTDLSKFHGDGWKLISEEDRNHEANPFSELLKEFDKE